MRRENTRHTTSGILRRLLFMLLATLLAQPVTSLAQQSNRTGANDAGMARATRDDLIRPFSINVPEEALVDLRRRLASARWSVQETVSDRSQGVQLATMKELVRYWETRYDWRKGTVTSLLRRTHNDRTEESTNRHEA